MGHTDTLVLIAGNGCACVSLSPVPSLSLCVCCCRLGKVSMRAELLTQLQSIILPSLVREHFEFQFIK